MRLWHITRRSEAASSLSGAEARKKGGRWNPRGLAVAYFASSLSLAVLEFLAHLAENGSVPADLVSVAALVPDDLVIPELQAAALPQGWRETPPPRELAERGEAWVAAGTSAILRVPSALVPLEPNYLVNPAHPESSRLAIERIDPLVLDRRLIADRAA